MQLSDDKKLSNHSLKCLVLRIWSFVRWHNIVIDYLGTPNPHSNNDLSWQGRRKGLGRGREVDRQIVIAQGLSIHQRKVMQKG